MSTGSVGSGGLDSGGEVLAAPRFVSVFLLPAMVWGSDPEMARLRRITKAMPPRKSRDKKVQPAQVEHVDDSPVYLEGENDLVVPPLSSPFVERSYGNPIFKEREWAQDIQKIVEKQEESSRQHDEAMRQYMVELRRIFEEGSRPRPEIPPPAVEISKQIQEASILALGGPGNQPDPNVQHHKFFMGDGQRNTNQWRLLLLLQTMAINLSIGIFRQLGGEMWVLIINPIQGTFSSHKSHQACQQRIVSPKILNRP
ncbi:hypothetical protein SLEP1_g59879 [Rubroshorea leprosula]|uniref:Uncharacterized protein n=1 Tax=Rubroshorea leprosula TaxID=152421 RepID=A0AAV5MTN5_9ROSI|nr:hypothetical protein SLEP1_g59879 [Rubroshorea leprosula]